MKYLAILFWTIAAHSYEGCFPQRGNQPEALCIWNDGQILIHRATIPSGGYWQVQDGQICVHWTFGVSNGQTFCAPIDSLVSKLGFQNRPLLNSYGKTAGGSWLRHIQLPNNMDSAFVFQNLPEKDGMTILGVVHQDQLWVLLRAESSWFKRWSASQLLPQMNQEILNQWQKWTGQYCENTGPLEFQIQVNHEGKRGSWCEIKQKRWEVLSVVQTKNGASLVQGAIFPEGNGDQILDWMREVDFK